MGQKVCVEHHGLLYTYGSRAPRVAIYLRIECMACQHAAASPPRDRLWRGKEADRMANHLMMVVVWKIVVKEFEAVKFMVGKDKSISAPLSLTVDSETEDRSYYTDKDKSLPYVPKPLQDVQVASSAWPGSARSRNSQVQLARRSRAKSQSQ